MRLTEWQRHLLVCLMEEAAEVQQAAAKLLRFEETGRESNLYDLQCELLDVQAVIGLVEMEESLVEGEIEDASYCLDTMRDKRNRIKRYYKEEQDAKQES